MALIEYEKSQWLIDQYQQTSIREKFLIQITLHALIAVIFIVLFIAPGFLSVKEKNREYKKINREIEQIGNHFEQLKKSGMQDPDARLKTEIAQLSDQKKELQQRIGKLTDALVLPDQMALLLENMLKQDKRLTINSLTTLPIRHVQLDQGEDNINLYRHGLKVNLTATYPGLLTYMKRLDAMKWRLYWQRLSYNVKQYPKGELEFEVYTLSTQEEVLGG